MGRQIAIFSDVHANLPALNAVLRDIDARGITDIFCLGDLVDFAPWPNEVIDVIRKRGIPTVMGNHDDRVGFDRAITPLGKHSPREQRAWAAAIALSKRDVTAGNRAFLAQLPAAIRLELHAGSLAKTLLLAHASPAALDEYIYADRDAGYLLALGRQYRCDALIMGHTHRAYRRRIARPGDSPLFIANTGATGRKKPGEPLATYLICQLTAGALTADIVTVDYDAAGLAAAIIASEIPDFYAHDFVYQPQLPRSFFTHSPPGVCMLFKTTWLSAVAAICVLSGAASAASPLPVRPYLDLATAQHIAQAAQDKAQASGWPCVIAVVDEAGAPLVLIRMDNAAVPAGVELAPGKARTAALFHRPSSDLETAINGKRPAAATARGFVMMAGGLPIQTDGHFVGGIGISSDTPAHDEVIAQAGVDAFKP